MHLKSLLSTHLLLPILLSTTAAAASPLAAARTSPTYLCNTSPDHPASRLGATKCVESLQEAANTAGGPTGGVITLRPSGELTRISEYTWTNEGGRVLTSFVEVRALAPAVAPATGAAGSGVAESAEEEAVMEVSVREVAGMLVGLIQGCSDRSCVELDCPVSGSFTVLDGAVEVRLLGN